MENFASARAAEGSDHTNGLQAEWLESHSKQGKLEPAAAKPGKDYQNGPGKDVADRLDAELRQFANEKQSNPSDNMLAFQQLVNKFEDSANKKQSISDFGHAASKIKVNLLKDAEDTYHKMEAEAAKVPGRKAMDADYSVKLNIFFDQVSRLPTKEHDRVMNLMEVKPDESLDQRDARVRDRLQNRPALLNSFNSMEAALAKIYQSKSPLERELDTQHHRDIVEAHTVEAIITKASIRSSINA